ncbi:MAG: GDP-mannose 4,6-dehydratase [Alphaproteobacteria bacterium]|nr:GDP-mannose 4,6-dehydratase [Alphaproteobacteria bacterium]
MIVGSAGQDGYYLSEELRQQGLRVVGLSRTGLFDGTSIIAPSVSLTDAAGIINLLAAIQPDFIYYLAAYHHSSQELEVNSDVAMRRGFKIHVDGFEIMLSAATKLARWPRVFLASSSHVFGAPSAAPQDENTRRATVSAYGLTKDMAMQVCDFYVNHWDLFCATGILYNHESPRRAAHFVSKRITDGVSAFARGHREPVALGNLAAMVDWGAAEDYVRAMVAILEQDTPDRFVIASGMGRPVFEFVEVPRRRGRPR